MDREKWARYCAFVGQQDRQTLHKMRRDLLRCVNLIDAHVSPPRRPAASELLLPWGVFGGFIVAAVVGVLWV